MASAKAKVYTSLVMVVDTKDLGETVGTLDLEFVHGKMVVATKGTIRTRAVLAPPPPCYIAFFREWMNGMAHGKGVETFPDGSTRHDGLWVEDEPVMN
jgi:MORN repeat